MPEDINYLISEIKKGSQQAFRKLVEKYQQYAFNLAFRILCNEEDAKDTVQDSFIKIWKNINQYEPKLKFTTWMYKIVTNTAIDKLRSRASKFTRDININASNLHLISDDNSDAPLENKELANLIKSITNQLPEKQKMVFILRDIQDLKSVEVQEILDLSETSVKTNLYNARKTVRKKLAALINYQKSTR
jgi:RNA polymerase sigma-70 factor (ECF subfamily)